MVSPLRVWMILFLLGLSPFLSAQIVRVVSITEFKVSVAWGNIAAGPDGALWFPEGTGMGRMTTDGTLIEFSGVSEVRGVAAGPDGNIWFTEAFIPFVRPCPQPFARIGRITTAGVVTKFDLPN